MTLHEDKALFKEAIKTIALSSGILLALYIIQWWVLYLSPFNIPTYIPGTPINIGGLLIWVTLILLLLWLIKRLLLVNSTISIWKLTGIGVIVGVTAEFLFQLIRQETIDADSLGDRLHSFFLAILVHVIFSSIISFLISFQLKTKRSNVSALFIIILFIAAYFIKRQLMPS
jgi:hypothetical protein